MNSINSLQPTNLDTSTAKTRSLADDSSVGMDQAGKEASSIEKVIQPNQSASTTPKEDMIKNDMSASEIDEAMSSLNEKLQVLQSYLMFEKDEDTDKMVFFIKNSESDEVLRQVPSQELLSISKNITEYLEMANQASGKSLPPVGILTNEVV